ncbi:MAG: fluoride efflux transporter CrcB [Clostridia bacterium]|nr:fluoride efflux transporter CrcB [Clostridia bacterium]
MNILFVGLGGALGAVSRYAAGFIPLPLKSDFPFHTFLINLAGAVIIGFLVGMFEKDESVPAWVSPFAKVGFCGGFTTFSTFSLETVTLFENNKYLLGILYAAASCILCCAGVILGKRLAGR